MHEHHALVPSSDRSALLLVNGQLPVVRVEERRIPEALVGLERDHGITAPFLRIVRRKKDGEPVATLIELDATEQARGDWVSLDAVDPAECVPWFGNGVEQWLAEQRGAPIPHERPQWARPGWLAEASRWVAERSPLEGDPEIVRHWPLSAVYRFPTRDGVFLLKAVFSLFRHEPAVTVALSRQHPGDVPDVLAVDADRGWMLMREVDGAAARGDQASGGMRVAARIQRAWQSRADELADLGCQRRPIAELRAETADLANFVDRLEDACVAETIVHGDLHHANMLVADERTTVIDWSDAAIGHPLLDLATVLFVGEKDRDALFDAFMGIWECSRELASAAEVVGCLYQAVSYRAIGAALEPTDRWLFGESYEMWLERARRLAEGGNESA